MKSNLKILGLLMLFCLCMASGSIRAANSSPNYESHDWLKIYYMSNGINRINAHPVNEIDRVEYRSEVTKEGEPAQNLIHVFTKSKDEFILPVDSILSMVLGGNIPTLYIDTDFYVEEIPIKDYYMSATLRYITYENGTDPFIQKVNIKGRGNSSWGFPKKPYRLKFDKKQSFEGLIKAKSFVLLSNYIDNTLMRNAVAMKIAELINLPYTNKVVPVNLIFNGQKRGNYMLTNKPGINSGSVDIDEKEGILWEIDTNFDEEFKFYSEHFNLPCMVKDPDFHEITDNSEAAIEDKWSYWKSDLEKAFQLVEEGKWREAFDEEQFIKYFIVQDLVLNTEIEFPKSFYIYKESKDDKYKLGPCWDYDWSFGYHHDINRGVIYKGCGSYAFLSKIFEDPEFIKKFKEAFNKYCNDHIDEIMLFIDEYAETIRDSALADALIWPAEHYNTDYEHSERNTNHFDENVKELKDWIFKRIEIIKNSPKAALF